MFKSHWHLILFLSIGVRTISYSQTNIPLEKNSVIDLRFDESGKLRFAPDGFALIEKESYKLNITVDRPVKQLKQLWKLIADKCKATKKNLEDPDLTYAAQFSKLFPATDLTTLKGELDDMILVLTDPDPKSKFANTPNTFKFFLGRNFIENQLFGNIFTVYNSQSGVSTSSSINSDYSFQNIAFTCPEDSFVVSVTVADLSKQFLRNYYNEARRQITLISTIEPGKYYRKEVPQVLRLQKSFDSLLQVLNLLPNVNPIVCDDKIVARHNELITEYNSFKTSSYIEQIIQSDWLKYWYWYSEGKLLINPLSFTDEGLLVLKNGYDADNAQKYDEYILSVIKLMNSSSELSHTKADYVQMDSLLRQQGKGSERFSYTSLNDDLKRSNTSKQKSVQTIEYTIHRIVFKAVPADKSDKYFMRIYNADKNLKASEDNFSNTVSTDIQVDAMVYNIKAGQGLELKESAKSVADQSKIITQLNEIGDAGASVFAEAAKALPIYSGLTAQFNSPIPDPTINPVAIAKAAVGYGVLGLTEPDNKSQVRKYYVRATLAANDLRIRIFADHLLLEQSKNMLQEVDNDLQSYNFNQCPGFVKLVHQQVIAFVLASTAEFAPSEDVEFKVSDHLIKISEGIEAIIEQFFKKYSLRLIYNETVNAKNYLTAIADFLRPIIGHQLPPSKFESEKDDDPMYKNQLLSLAKEETAKQKDFEITLSSKKSEIKLKDTYTTAPTHWVTGSLGVAYIFNEFRRNEATVSSGSIVNKGDEDQVRLVSGLNFYVFRPIILKDDRSVFQLKGGRDILSRLSIFAAVSYPKPLYNLHPGLSIDIWPGIKITAGAHFFRYTSYTILNNQQVDQDSKYVFNGGFTSLTIDPVTFVKLIGFIK